jgi:hypothetical protein
VQTQPRTQPTADTTAALVHFYCPTCNPTPTFGQTLAGLCGTPKAYLGDQPGAPTVCAVCTDLAALQVLPCGHTGWPHSDGR